MFSLILDILLCIIVFFNLISIIRLYQARKSIHKSWEEYRESNRKYEEIMRNRISLYNELIAQLQDHFPQAGMLMKFKGRPQIHDN